MSSIFLILTVILVFLGWFGIVEPLVAIILVPILLIVGVYFKIRKSNKMKEGDL